METLNQKRVLITGAARGLGRALALRLASEGTRLILVDCDAEKLCGTAGLVSDQATEVATFECDLTDSQRISETVAMIREQFQGIDVLINNAGVAWYGSAANMPAEEWDRVIAVNLLAPVQLIREFLPDLQAQPEAHILNVSSVYGLIATNRATAYHCTKFALVGSAAGGNCASENNESRKMQDKIPNGLRNTNAEPHSRTAECSSIFGRRWILATSSRTLRT